jgi:hypothetical protein
MITRLINLLPILSLVIGGWAILNGVLHDAFILAQGRKYDRDLLRLLMDGHILLTCGAIQMLAWKGIQQNQSYGYYMAGVATISLLVYCAMIYPFLKSFGIFTLNLAYLSILAMAFFKR